MLCTSSEANKLLKKLNNDYKNLEHAEMQSSSFLAATGEDIESIRPSYDYAKTQKELKALALKIRTVKHAINVFNTNTVIKDFDMTIDEMLVFLPQLTNRVYTLEEMKQALPKAREKSYGIGTNTTIDYRYANYDIEMAAKDYDEAYDLLTRAQTALDTVNNTLQFEIDI